MTKKNAPAALQTEVTTDEEWAKILERKGLVLADVYSEWSGPCTGMVSILKKVKMEIGGDNLSYATARCDHIASLARFRGKSEPTWMFIRDGKMVNLIFGANCPELLDHLTRELKRLQTGETPEFSMSVSDTSPKEAERMKAIEAAMQAKEAARIARIEAEAKEKYEAELGHLVNSLSRETFIILFPWIFKDEEGNKRDKKSSPPYIELVEQLLPENFTIEQELKKQLDADILAEMQKECEYVLSEETKRLLTEGKCLCLRLKVVDKIPEADIDNLLFNILFGEPRVPETPEALLEGCFVQRNLPPLREFIKDTVSIASSPEMLLCLTTVWVPLNSRNKAMTFRVIFAKYVETTYPYEDLDSNVPTIMFKYDSTRRKELQVVLEMYSNEVVHFGVFERDRLPDAKLIASSIEEFENEVKEKSSYEVFVCVVKKVGSEAFLSFAGIGPYHVSESPEKAIEEAKQYFPRKSTTVEETQSDEEDKVVEETMAA
ncbi:uncharacterized protein LOC100678333 isoform X2 [Nasonia vitripennis]|nr:uncharacterized protein LOC100678333 isoform X2 [Nasonia vitripennis]